MNALLGVNINYNVVFFSGQSGETETQAVDSVSPGYEGILRDISRRSGGMSVISTRANLVESLETIAAHVDVYYELAFAVGAEPEDKRIEINVTPTNAGVYYKNRFKKDELKWLRDWVKQEINLSGFVLEGHGLSFTVAGFKMNRLKDTSGKWVPTGMIKIDIRLIDDQNTTVYETGNTLKANDQSFKISLNLPAQLKGYFKLSITAVDLVANKSCHFNTYVKI
jgi:hypothetical protein